MHVLIIYGEGIREKRIQDNMISFESMERRQRRVFVIHVMGMTHNDRGEKKRCIGPRSRQSSTRQDKPAMT